MPVIHGKNVVVHLDNGAGGWDDVSDVFNSISYAESAEASDSTTFGDDGWNTSTNGLRSATFSAEGFHVDTQMAKIRAAQNRDAVQVRIRPNGTGATKPQILVSLTGLNVNSSYQLKDNQAVSVSATVTGAPDHTAQA